MADTVSIWFVALNDLEVTEAEFAQAKRKSLSLEWPPTAPFDFLKLSRQGVKSSEYPDTRKAYEHAVDYSGRLFDDRTNWLHVVIHETAYRIGFTKLAINPERLDPGDCGAMFTLRSVVSIKRVLNSIYPSISPSS